MVTLENKRFSHESPYLVAFFNLHYYLCQVPFKTELSGREAKNYNNRSYFLKHNLTQKILCGVSNLGTLAIMTYGVVEGAKQLKLGDPSIITLILYWIGDTGSLLSAIAIIHFTWWRQDQYLELVERTRVPVSWKKRKIIQMLAC